MSRLYIKISTDRRAGDIGIAVNEYAKIRVYFGSSKNSIYLGSISVDYPKLMGKPTVKWLDAKSTE